MSMIFFLSVDLYIYNSYILFFFIFYNLISVFFCLSLLFFTAISEFFEYPCYDYI